MNMAVTDLGLDIAGKTILDGITLNVRTGEFLSLLGESGAGKSTLLKIIAGITVQSRGTVAFDGTCIDETPVTAVDAPWYSRTSACSPT